MLDTSAASPLYKQLKSKILASINNKTFKPGDKLPTEIELSEHYQVSRVTVRTAMEELVAEGYIVRYPGKGTFIAKEKLIKNVSAIHSFSETCKMQNKIPGSKVLKCVIEDSTPSDQEELALEPGSKVIVIERIRYANDIPVSVEYTRFPSAYAYLLQEDLNNTSIYQILKEKHNISFGVSRKYIELDYATFDVATYLQTEEGHPLLSIKSTVTTDTGERIHRSKQLILGDQFQLIV